MAPELENCWFERIGKGRWCGTGAVAWQGRALTAFYSAAVALAAAFLADRTVLGFAVALALATAICFAVVVAKTRCEPSGRG